MYRLALLPRWIGLTAFLLAAINLAFVPALYFGDNAADFYSAQGWGTTARMGARRAEVVTRPRVRRDGAGLTR